MVNQLYSEIKFIDSFRFMSRSLSNLADNLSEGIHCDKCIDKCKSCLDYMSVKDDQFTCRYFECKKNYKRNLNKELIKIFANIYEFCNEVINEFILLVRKDVYHDEYMDSWEKFDETPLPDKETFYKSLNMEDITDADHRHAEKIFKNLNNKNLGDHHDFFYVQIDTLLLADVFKSFRNKCIEIYELDPAHFLSAPGLSWQAC